MLRETIPQLGKDPHLTAIITTSRGSSSPSEGPHPPGFIFLNAGVVHRVGPNRLHVTLSRGLAEAGFPSIRFDVSGLGDSGPRSDGLLYAESRIEETRTIMDYAQRKGLADRFVVCGICSGADHAFHVAVADQRVVGVAMLDGYTYRTPGFLVRRFLPFMMRPRNWWGLVTGRHPGLPWNRDPSDPEGRSGRDEISEGFVMYTPPREEVEEGLASFVARDGQVLAVYTGGLKEQFNHARQFWTMFPALRKQPRVTLKHWPDASHTFTLQKHQMRLQNTLRDWATRCWPPGPRRPPT